MKTETKVPCPYCVLRGLVWLEEEMTTEAKLPEAVKTERKAATKVTGGIAAKEAVRDDNNTNG